MARVLQAEGRRFESVSDHSFILQYRDLKTHAYALSADIFLAPNQRKMIFERFIYRIDK